MLSCVECDFSYEDTLEECPRCAELEQVERPDLIAVAAMTAEFITQAGSSKLEAKIGELWPKNDDVSFKLISEVERKFKGKNKFHSYFSENNSIDSAPSLLKTYIGKKIIFSELVKKFMDSLVAAAKEVGVHKVAGGNIVFMHYKGHEDTDIGRLLAIWVTKKNGFDFDEESLVPKDSSHLNLDALRQAALFDLTLFDEVYPNVPTDDTYLKFIKGTSTGAFFKTAFGCDERNAGNVDSIKNLRHAVSDYQDRFKLSNDFYMDATAKVETLLKVAQKSGKPISLSTLCNAVDSLLPSDSPLKGTFESFINNNGYEINHHIEPTLNSIKAGQSIELVAGDKSFSAKILKKQIGPASSGHVVEYEDGRLTLIIVDPEQKKELMKLATANAEDE
ncbi:nucleoid-associated protein [uncultured Pseudoalteromonas sp.]|uniref:nucleoid-associated protein n=2 Tax=Pseudoalteromonas TaxID=53246 RepID=UPI0025FBC0B8|nr:nucleoid-associated protein [uncultured Pseudoalteromonas sp.]